MRRLSRFFRVSELEQIRGEKNQNVQLRANRLDQAQSCTEPAFSAVKSDVETNGLLTPVIASMMKSSLPTATTNSILQFGEDSWAISSH